MKTDKIRNYNQYLLAIFGTLGCVLLLLAIVMIFIEIISLHYPGRGYDNDPHGLIAEDKADVLNQENLRKQIISYESPWLVDTLQSIYIVPVSITTLKKPEEVIYNIENEELLGLLNSYGSRKSYNYRRHFNGTYANLIIYDPKKETTESLFNERLVIGELNIYYFDDDILLVFYTASKDTNKNGIIDLDDSKDLCIYSMSTHQIRRISEENNEVRHYQFIANSKDMLIQFRLGHYQPNQFDNRQSPGKILKYDYETDRLLPVVPEKIQEQMQKLIEGKDM